MSLLDKRDGAAPEKSYICSGHHSAPECLIFLPVAVETGTTTCLAAFHLAVVSRVSVEHLLRTL